MHLVVAVLKPTQLEAVRQALAAVHVTRLTICDAQGYDSPADSGSVAQEAVVEIAVNDDFLARTVDTIAAAMMLGDSDDSEASSGTAQPAFDRGTGRLFVLPINETVQIYREVRGPEAL